MDAESKELLEEVGIYFNSMENLDNFLISREELLTDIKYEKIKILIPELKKRYSSSFMTSLQKNADKLQKWPLINIVRQILHVYGFRMEPIRKSDGYTLEGVKKYKRFFQIKKKQKINYATNLNNVNDEIT